MQTSKERLPEPPAGGLARLKHDSAVTAAELREFLGHMRGKSPQEVLGIIAGNSLMKCTLWVTVVTVVFLLLSSTVVYLVTPDKAKTAKAKSNPAAQAKTDAAAQADDKAGSKSDTTAGAADETIASGDKTLDNLGMGETKIVAPDKNPLEDKFDDLLNKKIE